MKKKQNFWLGVGILGGVVTGYKLWRQYQARKKSPLKVPSEDNQWALITGATSKIGSAYAQILAERGYQLILVADQSAELGGLASELAAEYRVHVQALAVDLSTFEGIKQLEALVANLENLNVLVNNAAFDNGGTFARRQVNAVDERLHLHITAAVRLTRAALPEMLANSRGAIINVSSLSAYFPQPGEVLPCATASYLNAFTEALHHELAGSGVRVQALCLGGIGSALQDGDHRRWPVVWPLAPEKIVDRSLRDIANDKVISVPGSGYGLLKCFHFFIPHALLSIIWKMSENIAESHNQFSGYRKRTWHNMREFITDLRDMYQHRQQLKRTMNLLDHHFMRRLMLVVTHVNGCRYCASFHAKSALVDGMSPEEVEDLLQGVVDNVPENELHALLYAQYWADVGGHVDLEIRQDLVDRYGEELTGAIEGALRMIKMGNYAGNAFDYFLYILSSGRLGAG